MKPLGFPLLADEIGPDVVAGLRERGCNVRSVEEEGLLGQSDTAVLLRATDQRRAVITHDLAFGKSAIRAGTEFVGIIYLRPGHISGAFVLSVVDALGERARRIDSSTGRR